MKKILLSFFVLLAIGSSEAQVLNMPEVIQEQDQWCWAGVSKSVLNYYGFPPTQCEIAEYAREVITWTNFGSVDCCTDAGQGCNYWNYNWGLSGSIQDILVHFGSIQNHGVGTLTLAQINTEIAAGRPFIAHWSWINGGGHFVVGNGVSGNNVYYMNPWFGEGLHMSTYAWLVNDGSHSWDSTNQITTSPLAVAGFDSGSNMISLSPNPTNGTFTITAPSLIDKIVVTDALGKEVLQLEPNALTATLQLSECQSGLYFVKLVSGNNETVKKLILK